MKGIILHTIKYGSTREYSEMLKKRTGFPAKDLSMGSKPDLKNFIYGIQ